jgi:DtxR family Mn-dependent transcriptional regulator
MITISQAYQDYLKVIYQLTETSGRAATNQIAAALEVTPASVSNMLKKMAEGDEPLLHYQKHRGVQLTAVGQQTCLEILRHHRLLKTFLCEKLGFNQDEAHEEANRLDHVLTEELEARIAAVLQHPTHDPHGQPIPTVDLEIPEISNREVS